MDCNLNFEDIKPALADELYQVPITKYLIVTHGWLRHQSIVFQESKHYFQILASYWQIDKGRHICKIASQIHFQQDNYIEEKSLYQEKNAKQILKAANLLAIQPFNHMFNNCRDSLRNLVAHLNNNNLNYFYEECKLPVYGHQLIIIETEQNFEDELITYCIRFHDDNILVFCGKQMNLFVNFNTNDIKQCKDLILPTMWFRICQFPAIKVSDIKKNSIIMFNANKQNHKQSFWGLVNLLNIYEIS